MSPAGVVGAIHGGRGNGDKEWRRHTAGQQDLLRRDVGKGSPHSQAATTTAPLSNSIYLRTTDLLGSCAAWSPCPVRTPPFRHPPSSCSAPKSTSSPARPSASCTSRQKPLPTNHHRKSCFDGAFSTYLHRSGNISLRRVVVKDLDETPLKVIHRLEIHAFSW